MDFFQSYRGATHGELIVVAGGRDANGTILKAVEIYDEDNGDWVAGPDLPKGLYEPTLTRFGNVGVVLAGEPFDPIITSGMKNYEEDLEDRTPRKYLLLFRWQWVRISSQNNMSLIWRHLSTGMSVAV